MTWFRKGEPREAWEIDDEGSVGDIEVARQIREICNSVAESAEAVSVLYYGPSTETKKRQIDRYERAKKDSVLANVLAAVSDSFYPAFAAC